jgi:hypothetical protein
VGCPKEPSPSPLRHQPLLGQTPRRGRSSGRDPLIPKKGGGRPPKADQNTRRLLEKDVQERPAATVAQRQRFLEHLAGTRLSIPAVRRMLERLGFSRKKRTVGAMERDEFLRAARRARWSPRRCKPNGWCSSMRWAPTSHFHHFRPGLRKGRGHIALYLATAARTPPCWRVRAWEAWVLAWR